MESPHEHTLATMLGAGLAQLPPIIDAEQVATLLYCSKGQVEDLAETGRLPGTKFGRGWVFVTAQIVHTVIEESASNAARHAESLKPAEERPPPSRRTGTTGGRSSKPLAPPPAPRSRGRPRKILPDCITK